VVRLDRRLDSDRQDVDRGLDHAHGAGGADSDRIPARTTRAGAARRLAVDLGGDPVRAAARDFPAAVVVIRDAVTGLAGPAAGPVRIRQLPAGRRRVLDVAGRGAAGHRAPDWRSRPEPAPADARGVG